MKMTFEQFGYWISGALEDLDPETMTKEELANKLKQVQEHLGLVFTKVTTSPIKVVAPLKDAQEESKRLLEIFKQVQKEVREKNDNTFNDYTNKGSPDQPQPMWDSNTKLCNPTQWPYLNISPSQYYKDVSFIPPRGKGAFC